MKHPFPFPVDIVRSKRRRKTVSIQVADQRVRVLCPVRTSEQYIMQLLERRLPWIQHVLSQQATAAANKPPAARQTYYFHGRPVSVQCDQGLSPHWRVSLVDGAFHVQGPVDAPPDDVLQALLREWYRTTARKDFAERLKRWSHRVGVTYQSFRVKDQKSRWGSCSSAGNINLNWRLVMAPEDAIDYVVVHELCHRLEMNHSPAFWAHVERAFPAYRQARRWLRDHGAQLMAVQL